MREQAEAAARYHLQRQAADLLAEGQSQPFVLAFLEEASRREEAALAAIGPALDHAERLLCLVEEARRRPAGTKPPEGLKPPYPRQARGRWGGGSRGRGGLSQ